MEFKKQKSNLRSVMSSIFEFKVSIIGLIAGLVVGAIVSYFLFYA